MTAAGDQPEIVTHRIPRIDVYQVTDDELSRLADGYAGAGDDLTFAAVGASFFVSFLIALLTSNPGQNAKLGFVGAMIASGLFTLYTGRQWLQKRKRGPSLMARIRSRRMEPEVSADKQKQNP